MKTIRFLLRQLFAEEKLLVGVSIIGFLLAAVCAFYILINGAIVLPEGNVQSAFSFNAAVAIFILTIAALLPLAGIKPRNRARIRWGFILTSLISYGIETIQHFRGINPRFTQEGSIIDKVAGGFFGLTSLVLIMMTVLLALSFFRNRDSLQHPLLIGIRYAFLSTMIAFAAGMGMIILQSRYLGSNGNFMVLHGLGFHALQALPLLGWLLLKSGQRRANQLIHVAGLSWMTSIILIGIVTALGRTMFELRLLPLLSASALFVCLSIFVSALMDRFKPRSVRETSQY